MSDERSALIEAVARAMVARQFNEWEQLDSGDQGYFMELADAAIASVIAHATSAESVERARTAWLESASDYTLLHESIKAAILAALNERQS